MVALFKKQNSKHKRVKYGKLDSCELTGQLDPQHPERNTTKLIQTSQSNNINVEHGC